jgi:hypothetical protein
VAPGPDGILVSAAGHDHSHEGHGHEGHGHEGHGHEGHGTTATATTATAATATVVGLGLVCGRGVVQRRGYGDRLRFLPVLGALALVALGLVVLVRGILELT